MPWYQVVIGFQVEKTWIIEADSVEAATSKCKSGAAGKPDIETLSHDGWSTVELTEKQKREHGIE